MTGNPSRTEAFGRDVGPTLVDRLGVWLSAHRIRQAVPSFVGKRVADVGCGHDATFARTILDVAEKVVLADLTIADDLAKHPKVDAIVGPLPGSLANVPDSSIDVVLCISVLEHLWEPEEALRQLRRILAPSGVLLLNVPSWAGKRFLELSAFTLKLSTASEIDDHKTYYDVKDLWPLLVRAGFRPANIKCFSHKLGLNTFAVCTKEAERAS